MVIYKQSSFDNDVHEIDIRRFFENICLELQFKPSPIQKCAPNECNVYEKDRWSAGEAGYAGLGHQHLIVSPTKIYAWYNIEEDWLHKKMVAFTFAHEIGHTGGLEHCSDPTCIMHEDAGYNFCDSCIVLLREKGSSW